jgi:uncharacterized protein (DUF2236 family)
VTAPPQTADPTWIAWQRAGDVRVILMAGYALLLQVAHPVVGAGVSEHSNFQADPWGRLLRTLDFASTMVYAGPEAAAAMGRALRRRHAAIRGTLPDGRPYHALEPEPYAWVHATLADAIVAGHDRFGIAFTVTERERFWTEWRALGGLLGIGDEDLPPDWEGFRRYVEAMVHERLERTTAVDDVLAALERPAPPRLLRRAAPAWHMGTAPPRHVVLLVTVGMLPPVLRDRFGLRWTRAQERELAALTRGLRAMTPLLPRSLRVTGPSYLRLRRRHLVTTGAR